MNNRARGDYFERQTRDALTVCGWYVIRSAGSLGVADLVALRAGNRPLMVSCKINGRIDPAERVALLESADRAGARPVCAMRPRNGRVQLTLVVPGSAHLIPLDTLTVPPRTRRTPPAPVGDPLPDEPVDAVPDGLYPRGEQLTLSD